MNRVAIKRLLDFAMYVCFCLLAGIGLLLHYRLPHGAGRRAAILGLDRHEWGDVHFWLGVALMIGVVVHLFLNFDWLVKIAARRRWIPLVAGLALGIALLVAPLLAPISRDLDSERHRGGRGHEQIAE
jgi:cell division protein FtsW (lipid II flippase)